MTLPAKFAERVLRDLGDSEGAALCAALDTEPPVSVRLEPGQVRRYGERRSRAGGGCGQGGRPFGRSAACRAGRRRRPGAVVRRRILPRGAAAVHLRQRFPCGSLLCAGGRVAVRGSYCCRRVAKSPAGAILDLCAAPGGKTTLLFDARGTRRAGRRERDRPPPRCRCWPTMSASGASGNVAVTTCEDPAAGRRFEAWFDVVAVDAPCSGEGMFRKDRDAARRMERSAM